MRKIIKNSNGFTLIELIIVIIIVIIIAVPVFYIGIPTLIKFIQSLDSNTPPSIVQKPELQKPELPVIPPLDPALYDIPALEADYRKKQKARNKQKAKIKRAKKPIGDLKNAISSARQMLTELILKEDNARIAFKKAQERVFKNPEFSSEQERLAYHQAQIAVEEKNNLLNQLPKQLAQAEKNVKEEQDKLENIYSEINNLKQKLKVGYFAHFKAKVEQEKKIDGYGDAGCNERLIEECKEAALQAALKNVSSNGSIILVDTETLSILDDKGEWKLTKDEIRTQSRGIVIGHEVLDEGPLGNMAAYQYKIRATVKGQIPPELQRQLLEP
jgi:prepilin-type N-terminal cleavage/methylation domain-containing protein